MTTLLSLPGLTTPVGAPKPDAWVEVVDKQSGLPYYWNQESGTSSTQILFLILCVDSCHCLTIIMQHMGLLV